MSAAIDIKRWQITSMLKLIKLSLTLLYRDLRAGNWIVLFFALFLSTATVTSLDFYTSRIYNGINTQSNRILGGDIAVISAAAIPHEFEKKAEELGIKHAQVWSFPTVARTLHTLQLINIQAVEKSYPLLDKS